MSAALRLVDAPSPTAERVGRAAFVLSLRARGIFDLALLRAMETVPRDLFAPRRYGDLARADVALPLPCGQTMSSPATVAIMLVALEVRPGQRVLEIGTGSGYNTALLAHMGASVLSIERRAILSESAGQRLAAAGLAGRARLACGDGLAEAEDDTRYDRILVNGALRQIGPGLTSQLRVGGRLVGALSGAGLPRLVTMVRAEDGRLVRSMGAPIRIAPLVDVPVGPETEI